MANGWLKFTPIAELNDPSEMVPILDDDAVRESLRVLRGIGFSENQFYWLRCQGALLELLAAEHKLLEVPATLPEANRMLSISTFDDLPLMQRRLLSLAEALRSKVGILSLSERYESLPMWAHYADNAKGYVAVLEDLDCTFRLDETGSLNTPKRVSYGERFASVTFDPSTQDRLFFSKLQDWSYEREWRIIAPLSACDQTKSKNGMTHYLQRVDPRHLAGVICGWRVSTENVALLQEELARLNPSARVIHARFSGSSIDLHSPLSQS